MGEVTKFTGPYFGEITPDIILAAAKGAESVIVIGERNGMFFISSSMADVGTIFLLLETAKYKILSGDYQTIVRKPS